MFITETLEFCQETLDTSVENFAHLIQYFESELTRFCDNVTFLIVMKKVSEYLKNHLNSRFCDIPLISLISQIRYKCIEFTESDDPNFSLFKTAKLRELNLNLDKYGVILDMLKVWFFIDRVLPILEDDFSRGEYGHFGGPTYFAQWGRIY